MLPRPRRRKIWWVPRALSVTVGAIALILVTSVDAATVRRLFTCEMALTQLTARIGAFTSERFFKVETTTDPTVRLIRARPGRHGGRILRLFKTGSSWVSSHRTVGYDPQGDPRWFITAAGRTTARFFGFRVINDRTCEVPDAAEFNGAIAAINEKLIARGLEPIPMTFYQTPDNENVKVAEYVARFRDSAGIPLAQSGNHLVHDLSFHTASIFFPPELVRFKQREVAFIESFISWLTNKYANDPDRSSAVRTLAFHWRMIETASIDNATGTLAPVLVSMAEEKSDFEKMILMNSPINWMLSDGLSHTQLMDGLIDDLVKPSARNSSIAITRDRRRRLDQALESLPTSLMHSDLIRFVKENDPHPWLFPDRFAKYADAVANDRLCREITERRAVIHDIVAEMTPPSRTRRFKQFLSDAFQKALDFFQRI